MALLFGFGLLSGGQVPGGRLDVGKGLLGGLEASFVRKLCGSGPPLAQWPVFLRGSGWADRPKGGLVLGLGVEVSLLHTPRLARSMRAQPRGGQWPWRSSAENQRRRSSAENQRRRRSVGRRLDRRQDLGGGWIGGAVSSPGGSQAAETIAISTRRQPLLRGGSRRRVGPSFEIGGFQRRVLSALM